MSWSAKQYVAFEDERTRPVRDLLGALPPIDARSVIDLGCGPGNSTEVLAARYPEAAAAGIDSSPDMIEAARARLPDIHFAVQDLQTWQDPGPFDVILANAVLQWVPDHEVLLPALVAKLAPGGALAVQMPDNLDEPAHRMMRDVAAAGPWASKLSSASRARVSLPAPDWYYSLLRPLCSKVDLWRTIYFHSLPGGANAVVEWFKGSGLRPFLEPLSGDERSAYLERYTAAISKICVTVADGSVLLPFPRVFLAAIR
ncbi:MAG TPA: trans-aconitate 2-methyltransferase [Steroidobacteraceae bacterium]|nr:trans-aconitate 2-methyltransferase [Steroidobacteraceae bacterium]